MTQALTITLARPDDWHLHVRDGDALRTVVPHTAVQFGRAIIMPWPTGHASRPQCHPVCTLSR
jgi:dihydroorotase